MHKAALAVNVALLIERYSRLILPRPPQTPIARLQYRPAQVGLCLEEHLYATKPPKTQILRQDEYFWAVEGLLEDTTQSP